MDDNKAKVFPERKRNRLKEYDYSQNGMYFVTICTKDKQKILSNIVGGDAHIAPLVELSSYGIIVDKFINSVSISHPNITIEKYVVMPNHIHLLIMIDGTMWASSPTTVSSVVRSIKVLTTKQLGKPIFQRSFHDHIIRNDEDYKAIYNYIESNPSKWSEDCFYTE